MLLWLLRLSLILAFRARAQGPGPNLPNLPDLPDLPDLPNLAGPMGFVNSGIRSINSNFFLKVSFSTIFKANLAERLPHFCSKLPHFDSKLPCFCPKVSQLGHNLPPKCLNLLQFCQILLIFFQVFFKKLPQWRQYLPKNCQILLH